MMGRMSRPHSRTGRKRWWLQFQYPVKTFPANIPTTTWTTMYSTWAEISQLNGDEIVWPQQVQDWEDFLIRCRWFNRAQQIERVVWHNRIFHVVQVKDVGSLHQELEIVASEMDPNV